MAGTFKPTEVVKPPAKRKGGQTKQPAEQAKVTLAGFSVEISVEISVEFSVEFSVEISVEFSVEYFS